jgi:hypothetical protein
MVLQVQRVHRVKQVQRVIPAQRVLRVVQDQQVLQVVRDQQVHRVQQVLLVLMVFLVTALFPSFFGMIQSPWLMV